EDPLTAGMAEYCRGGVIFFGHDPEHSVIREHLAKGGRAAFVRDRAAVLAEGDRVLLEMPLAEIPITRPGRVRFLTENAPAGAAAGWALGLAMEDIRNTLARFSNESDMVPGRFNVLSLGGATVILDYGHNVSALSALIEAIGAFPHERRTVVY